MVYGLWFGLPVIRAACAVIFFLLLLLLLPKVFGLRVSCPSNGTSDLASRVMRGVMVTRYDDGVAGDGYDDGVAGDGDDL